MGLISVLLADDNRLATEYLSCLIDWEAAGFQIVGKAIDGREALHSYKQLHPQLLITDISMPGMDGIALSREIRRLDGNVEIIFLSSYDEFDYARSALQLKVSEYILKHELDAEHLLEKLACVREEILSRRVRDQERLEKQLEHFLRSPKEPCPEGIGAFLPLLLLRDTPLACLGKYLGNPIPPVVDRKAAARAAHPRVAFVCTLSEDATLLLLSGRVGLSPEALEKLRSSLSGSLGSSLSLASLPPCQDPVALEGNLQAFAPLLHAPWFLGKGRISSPGDLPQNLPRSRHEGGYRQEAVRLLRLLEEGQETDFFFGLAEGYGQVAMVWDSQGFIELTEGLLEGLSPRLPCAEKGGQAPLTVSEVARWMASAFQRLSSLRRIPTEGLSRYTRLALSYVDANYQKVDLSVEEVADHIGIGVNYLNQVFREEMGMTVHRYLAQVRLQKAKDLLANTRMKIGLIPEQVGYADGSYFSKVFKKATGLTPFAYRQQS